MGSVGDSYDNALAENLRSVIKTECIRGRVAETCAEANLALFAYIDGWYNPKRMQKGLGWLSPDEYEEKHYAEQATANQAIIKPPNPP
ncbi:IS3 family transposase [Embleya sp. NBC_00888]|uniref:IS3 family transposase n=1 Tax=Embleya sp. NBC_00888 TaxID=2975960 RepID=UPI00386CE8D1